MSIHDIEPCTEQISCRCAGMRIPVCRSARSAQPHTPVASAAGGIKEDEDTYECVCCEKQHTQEFSLTCPECDSERESGGLELPKEYRD